jgi:hypothetical protein
MLKQFKSLVSVGLMINNGHGPELANFMQTQGPTSHTINRDEWEKRQVSNRGDRTPQRVPKRNLKGNDKEPKRNPVTPRSHPARDPKSQSQRKSQRKRKSQSISYESNKRPTDNLSLTITKTFIVENIGIPETQRHALIDDKTISPADLLSELTRNMARKGEGKGKVKNPAYVTALNLLKHEYPAADWYDLQKWANHLPAAILDNLGVTVPEKKSENADPDFRELN